MLFHFRCPRSHFLALSLPCRHGVIANQRKRGRVPSTAWSGAEKTSRSFHPTGREMVALAEAHQVVNVHISSLLGVFLTPELNPVWNDRLVEQRRHRGWSRIRAVPGHLHRRLGERCSAVDRFASDPDQLRVLPTASMRDDPAA